MFIILLFLFSNFFLKAENKEINTKNFRIIFQDKNKKNAIELASKVEKLSEPVFKFFNFEPYKKFTIIIENNIKENSHVDPFTSKITIIANTVRNKFIQKNYPFWLEYVFTHELVHAVISHKVSSFPLLPNIFPTAALVPRWFQEGLAVFLETELLPGGRGESDNFLMLVKDAKLQNNFKGLSISLFDTSHSYSYGYSFFDFYDKVYGREILKEKVEKSLNFLPISSFKIFTKNINNKDFYKNWLDSIKIENIGKEVKGKKEFEYYILNADLYTYNDTVYFIAENSRERKFLYSLEGTKSKIILDANNIKTFYPYKAMYHINSARVKNNPEDLLYKNETFISEVKNPIKVAVNDSEIIYVERSYGEEKLISTLRGLLIKDKTFKFGKLTIYENILYFDASKEGETSNYIYSLNLITNKLEKIVEGESPFIHNSFIYFSNFLENVSNIFRINLKNKKIEQLTNVTLGAFEPVVLNNKLYYLNYENEYHYLYSLEEKDFLKSEKTFKDNNKIYEKEIKDLKIEKYRKRFNFFHPIPYFNLKSNTILTDISFLMKDDIEENTLNLGLGFNNSNISCFLSYEHIDILKFHMAYNTSAEALSIIRNENREGFYSKLDLSIPYYIKNLRSNTKTQLILDTNKKVQLNLLLAKDYKQIFLTSILDLNKDKYVYSFGFKIYDFSLRVALPLNKAVLSLRAPGLHLMNKESKYTKFVGDSIALIPKSAFGITLACDLLQKNIYLDKGTYGGEFIFSKLAFNYNPSIILSEQNLLINKLTTTLFFGAFSVLPLKNTLGITVLNPLNKEFISETAYNLYFNVEIDL